MQPADLPFDIYRGDSYRLQLKLWDRDQSGVQQPLDLTDVVVKAEIRDRPAGDQITSLTCTVMLPNIIDVVLFAGDSAKLPRNGVWDLQLTYPSGEVKTPLAGQVKVTDDVTDSTPAVQHL